MSRNPLPKRILNQLRGLPGDGLTCGDLRKLIRCSYARCWLELRELDDAGLVVHVWPALWCAAERRNHDVAAPAVAMEAA